MTQTVVNNKNLKIKDIARLAGVSASAVSAALNDRPQISAKTRERIMKTVKKYNYMPQSSARALSGRRTYQLGFLVSSEVTLGLANSYFSTLMAGVGAACQARNYHMVVSAYDLSNISDFIMPPNVRQNSIDCLVLAGITDLEVIRELQMTGIPLIVIGGDYPEDVLCLKRDIVATTIEALKHLYELNHRRIYVPYHYLPTHRIFLQAFNEIKQEMNVEDFEIILEKIAENDEFEEGAAVARSWLEQNRTKRATALISSDQFAVGYLREVIGQRGRCPEDVSIITTESPLSRSCIIPLTSTGEDGYDLGKLAANLLFDLLAEEKSIKEIKKVLREAYKPGKLYKRASTGIAPTY
jgi:LacI family transcriptional regulator